MKIGIFLNKTDIYNNQYLLKFLNEVFDFINNNKSTSLFIYIITKDQKEFEPIKGLFTSSSPILFTSSFFKQELYCQQTTTKFNIVFQEVRSFNQEIKYFTPFLKVCNQFLLRYFFRRDKISVLHTIGKKPLFFTSIKQLFTQIGNKKINLSKIAHRLVLSSEESTYEKDELIPLGASQIFVEHRLLRPHVNRNWVKKHRLPNDYILLFLKDFSSNYLGKIIDAINNNSSFDTKALVFVLINNGNEQSQIITTIIGRVKKYFNENDATTRRQEREYFLFNKVFKWQLPSLVDSSSYLIFENSAKKKYDFTSEDLLYLGKEYISFDNRISNKEIKLLSSYTKSNNSSYNRTMKNHIEEVFELYSRD